MDWKLFSQLIVTFTVAALGWWIAHRLSARSDLANERRKLRIGYLLEAYRKIMQIKYLSSCAVFLASAIFSFNTLAADVVAHRIGSNKIYSISIVGKLQEGDFKKLIKTR